jgi:hypothetical protein
MRFARLIRRARADKLGLYGWLIGQWGDGCRHFWTTARSTRVAVETISAGA